MKQKILTMMALICLCFATLAAISIQAGQTAEVTDSPTPPSGPPASQLLPMPSLPDSISAPVSEVPFGCMLQPVPNPPPARSSPTPIQLPLSRFRQPSNTTLTSGGAASRAPSYTPREVIELADLTNFGERYLRDVRGRSAVHDPIVVLHETVGSAQSAVNYFQTPHPRDEDQVSYHTLIREDGTVIYLVPPDKRAYGAGDSVFRSATGIEEAVQTNPNFPPSVNNFAYHISLETPADGDNNNTSHSGYTNAQYQSLAWLVAKTGVPDSRITMHKTVDRSGQRMDPRSFNTQLFLTVLKTYPKTREISISCLPPETAQQ
jgi:hypothetical protein